jgi:PadR family transcriptional regulator, regulatory protein PadR
MARAKSTNPDFLNGVPELLVLQLLARTPMHGYEVVRAIARETGEALSFGEGCIYPILHRLESSGLLRAESQQMGNRTRIVYHLTAAGERRLADVAVSWADVVRAVNRVLHGGADVNPGLA